MVFLVSSFVAFSLIAFVVFCASLHACFLSLVQSLKFSFSLDFSRELFLLCFSFLILSF